jgi:hypothetical protein
LTRCRPVAGALPVRCTPPTGTPAALRDSTPIGVCRHAGADCATFLLDPEAAARMIRPPVRTRGALALAAVLAAALCAELASAARVVDVRVGRHPDFVRIVFETDAPVGFALEDEVGPEGEVHVRLDASASARRIAVPGDPDAEVRVEPLPDGGTLARIRSSVPVRIESQVLERPPRVVLDLRPGPEPEPASAVEGDAPTAPAPGVASPPDQETPPTGEPGSVELSPPDEPVVGEAPDVEPPGVAPPTEPEPATVAAVEPTPPATAEPEPARAEPEPTRAAPEPTPEPEPEPSAAAPEPAPAEPETKLPPVSAPAPLPSRALLDDRALGLLFAGGLGGLLVGVLAAAPWRRRAPPEAPFPFPVPPPPVEAPAEVAVAPSPEPPVATPPPGPGPDAQAGRFRDLVDGLRPGPEPPRDGEVRESDLASDLLSMIQALDRRFASLETDTRTILADAARLAMRQGAQGEELAAQRTAIARLERLVRGSGLASSPRRDHPIQTEPAAAPR